MLWWLLVGCGAEEALVTSPLVGATRIRESGVDEIAEVLPAGSYTYFRLKDRPETWLVVNGRPRAVGETVAWRGYAEAHHFESRRLNRTFDHLVFASMGAVEAK